MIRTMIDAEESAPVRALESRFVMAAFPGRVA